MGKYTATRIADGELPAMPSPNTLQWEAWTNAAMTLHAHDPITRTRSYRYVSSSGNDSNDGLTPSTPKLTLAAVEALLGPNVGILMERGSVFKGQSITLDETGSMLGSYGTGERPVVWGLELVAGTWSNVSSTNRWTITAPRSETTTALLLTGDPDSKADRDAMLLKPFIRVFSTTDCNNTPGSFFQSTTTLSIHLHDSGDPNAVEVWRKHRTGTTPNASGVRVTDVDGVLLEDFEAWGFGDVSTQLYCIKWENSGTNTVVVRNCGAYYASGHHTIGHYVGGGGGGISIVDGVEYGYCSSDTNGQSTIGVDFTRDGGQEFWWLDCDCIGGQIGFASNGAGLAAVQGTFPLYWHTGATPPEKVRMAFSRRMTIETLAGNKIGKPPATDSVAHAVPSNQNDLTSYTGFRVDEVYRDGSFPGCFGGYNTVPGIMVINADWGDVQLIEAGSNNGGILGPMDGIHVNCIGNFIVESEASELFGIHYGGSAGNLPNGVYIHCDFRYTYTGDPDTSAVKCWANTGNLYTNKAFGCIFGYANTTDPARATFASNRLNFSPATTPALSGLTGTGGMSDCAFERVTQNTSGGYTGITGSQNGLNLTTTYGWGTTSPLHTQGAAPAYDSPLVGHVVNIPESIRWEYDIKWNVRRFKTAGPVEASPFPSGAARLAANYIRRRRARAGNV